MSAVRIEHSELARFNDQFVRSSSKASMQKTTIKLFRDTQKMAKFIAYLVSIIFFVIEK